jgi:hypothetical protein
MRMSSWLCWRTASSYASSSSDVASSPGGAGGGQRFATNSLNDSVVSLSGGTVRNWGSITYAAPMTQL